MILRLFLLLTLILAYFVQPVNAQLTTPSTQCVTSAEAGGTGDALTIGQLPCFPTTNLLVLLLTATNTTTTPTLEVTGSGIPAQTIKAGTGDALAVGELVADTRVTLTYDGTYWYVLSNPSVTGAGSVTSVGVSVPASSIFAVTGSPITSSGTIVITTTGTSGGIPYFSNTGRLSSSGALTANLPVIGGGSGASPTVGTVTGTGTQFVVSSSPTISSPTFSGTVAGANTIPLSILSQIATRTILGNTTGGTANVTAGWGVSGNANTLGTTTGSLTSGHVVTIDASGNFIDGGAVPASGTVSSVAFSVPGASIFGISGSPITSSGTLALTTSGTSGGVPYFSSASVISSSGALTANLPVIGGGAGAAPTVGTVSGTGTQFVVATSPTITTPTLTSPALSGTVTGNNTVPLAILSQIATRTLLGNTTGGTANVTAGWTVSGDASKVATTTGSLTNGNCVEIDINGNFIDAGAACSSGGGGGSVTSVGLSVPGSSIFGVTSSPITTSGTIGLTTTGTSGGIPYFSSGTQISSSAALTANMPVIGGGAGVAPSVGTVTGTGTVFALATSPTFVTPALGTIVSGNLSAGTVTATGGTTNSSLAGRFGNMLDLVKDFGADPTGLVDVGPIIAAITTTKPIHVPNGLYLWSTNQTSLVNLNLWCDGAAEYNGSGAVPSATGIQGSWFYRTSNVSWTITPFVTSNGAFGGYVAGGIRNCAFAETQPAVTMNAGTTSTATGFTGTSAAFTLAVASTTGLTVGMGVSDVTNPTYIAPNTYITAVTLNTSISINLPLPHNVANTDTLKFGGTGFTGTSGTAVLAVADTTGLSAGMGVSDFTHSEYVPPGSTILSVVANTSITISNNLTANVISSDVLRFWKPTVYDPWLKVVNNNGEIDLTGIYCYGVYQCIKNNATGGNSNGRLRIDHLRAHSFLHLIELDQSLDSVWIYDARDWTYWSSEAAVANWTITNGISLYMGYANGGPEIVNFFAIGKKACLNTYQSTGGFLARIVNFYCDFSKYGIWNTSSSGTNLQISNALLNGGGYAAGTTAESVAIQDDGNGVSGSHAVIYIDSIFCGGMSVACINGTNTTSGAGINIGNLQINNVSGAGAVKFVNATGPYYFSVSNVQNVGFVPAALYNTNNAIISGLSLNDGQVSGAAPQGFFRFDNTGTETTVFSQNKSSDTGSATCAGIYSATNIAANYAGVRTCNNNTASLLFGAAITSPAITHAGGGLTIGTISSGTWNGTKIGLAYGGTNADLSGTGGTDQFLKQSSTGAAITVGTISAANLSNGTTGSGAIALATSPTITTPNMTSGGSPAATLAFSASFPNWLFSQSNAGGISQLTVKNTGSGAATFSVITAQTHSSGNYYMQFYADEGGAQGVLTTGSDLTNGLLIQSGFGGIKLQGVATTTSAGGKHAVCADTGSQPVALYISSGATC